ncbi:MAG: GTPase [Thermoguttaceae bacterium]
MRVVRLTPPGRGAVACVLVEGPGAAEAVQAVVRTKSGRPLADFSQDSLVLGYFNVNGEEVVLRPRSPKTVELHCHGGYAAAAMIEETFKQRGCQVVAWQQWISESQTDKISAAALAALADAPTQRTAGILLDQYHGAMRRAFDAIGQDIKEKNFAAARSRVESLMACISLGLHLTKPWRVVVAGPPNAGKSSLINAMVGFQRSIVHHAPGTTRDAVTAITAMDGWPVELCDTAGLHAGAQGIEKAGVELARQRISDADLVVLVFDLASSWSVSDQALADSYPNALRVHNKVDVQYAKDNRPTGPYTSALTGIGIDELIIKIVNRLVPVPPPPGAAVPFTLEQFDQLRNFSSVLDHKVQNYS